MRDYYNSEQDGMIDFYEEIGYEDKVDYSCFTDGRLMVGNELGTLNEFKKDATSPLEVFEQMQGYVKLLNSRAKPLPKFGIYICLNTHEYQIFKLDTDYDHSFEENGTWETPLELRRKMENTETFLGWIDEDSIVAYNDLYFENNKAKHSNSKLTMNEAVQNILNGINNGVELDRVSKDQFIEELRNPCYLPIRPYVWDETGEMERDMLDQVGEKQQKKRLGAFFTPAPYCEKITSYVLNAVKNFSLETEDYLIIDRCAGTGNLEQFLPKEILSHVVLNTIVATENATLHGLYHDKVFAILPEHMNTTEDGLFVNGNALEKPFNDELKELIEGYRATCEENGKALRLVFLENPPYIESQSGATRKEKLIKKEKDDYITKLMKSTKKFGTATNESANKFIWSAFNLYNCDHYIVFSPIKYWKSQHIIDEKFIEGFIANRKCFHTESSAGISVIHWENMHGNVTNEELKLEAYDIENNCLIRKGNVIVEKIHNKITDLCPIINDNDAICWLYHGQGTPDFKHGYLINKKQNLHLTPKFLNTENTKKYIPLFVANCYTCKDFTQTEIIMKSGDGGLAYQSDEQFLNDCFVWAGLSDANKCESTDDRKNEYCFCQNTKADALIGDLINNPRYSGLFNRWKAVLRKASEYEEFNPDSDNYPYGLFQLNRDVNINIIQTDYKGRIIKTKTGDTKRKKLHPELDAEIKLLKQELKEFYDKNIEEKLFSYKLLK